MHPSQIPEKPLVPGIGKIEEAERIYFFERENGTTFACKGSEAWGVMKRGVQVLGLEKQKCKFIGSSDGLIFRQAVVDAQKLFKTSGLQAAQELIRKGEKDELEKARGNMVYPPNYDTITRGGAPVRIDSLR